MKRVFSFAAAIMVALFAMVSCGSVQSAKDGMAAGEEYAKAFQAANGDVAAIAAAYDAMAKKAAPYAADQIQSAMYMSGVFQSAEELSADAAGAILYFYKKGCEQQGIDAEAVVNAMLDNAKDKAAVQAGLAKFDQMIADNIAAQQASAEAEEAEEAEDAEDAEGEADEAAEVEVVDGGTK